MTILSIIGAIAITIAIFAAIVWVFRNFKTIAAIIATLILVLIGLNILLSPAGFVNGLKVLGYILFGVVCISLGIFILSLIRKL